MTLGEKQEAFTRCVEWLLATARLVCAAQGCTLRGGEWQRGLQQAEWNARQGLGIVNSLHRDKLAVDLLAFRGGELVASPHEVIGPLWEQFGKGLGLPLTWGGRFHDPSHYSFSDGGRK